MPHFWTGFGQAAKGRTRTAVEGKQGLIEPLK